VQKVCLEAGLTCPNRDKTVGTRGCIFCDARGSRADDQACNKTIQQQMEATRSRTTSQAITTRLIAYFQSFTNTYAPLETLRTLFDAATAGDDVVGLFISTRPDCVPDAILDLIASYQNRLMVQVEYGIQTASEKSLLLLNRGHDLDCVRDALARTKERGIACCGHVILGIPQETPDDMMATADFLTSLNVDAVKIHCMHVLRQTQLEAQYRAGHYIPLEEAVYVDLVVRFLERLHPDVVIHRLTGEGPPNTHIAPAWAHNKNRVIEAIRKELVRQDTWQGKNLKLNQGVL